MTVREIVRAIEGVLPERRPIRHHEPHIYDKELQYVNEALYDGVAGDNWVKRLEAELACVCGTTQAIVTSSGTAALHVVLLASGIQPNEEVLVPALTFAGTAHAVSYCGATPNFVDGSLCINPYKLRRYLERTTCANPNRRGRLNCKTGRVISALIVVDLLGFPADWVRLSALADEFGLILIEDAAQALGASLGNQPCGSFGKAAILSFNNNKIVTGNGGGAVLTNDEWIAAKCHQLSTTARTGHPWKVEHDALGYNYRMGNLNASLACAQLERLQQFVSAKKALFSRYDEALQGLAPLLKANESWHGSPNYWLITLMLKPEHRNLRDDILNQLHEKGIHARALFTPLHQLPHYAKCPQDTLHYAEDTFSRAICLPSGVAL